MITMSDFYTTVDGKPPVFVCRDCALILQRQLAMPLYRTRRVTPCEVHALVKNVVQGKTDVIRSKRPR